MRQAGFWSFARAYPASIAVVEVSGRTLTAGELLAQSHQIVSGLRALGLSRGDCVAMALPNSSEVLALFMAATEAGLYLVPINWHLTASEIAYVLTDSNAKVFVASERIGQASREAAEMAGVPAVTRFAVGSIEGFRPFSELIAGQPTSVPDDRSAGAAMTYTSGTTGKPKGVRRPVGVADPDTVAAAQAGFLSLFGILPGSEGVHLVCAPLYHTAVLNFATNHLHLGHTLVLMDKWSPELTLECISQHRVTSSHMVPTMFNRLLKIPPDQRKQYDVSSLRHVIHSAAPCPIETKRNMLEWWGPCIYEYYSASEGGGTLATPEQWLQKPGTVGKAWPISEIRILDDARAPVAQAETGTVWIRMGDFRFEYHKDQQKTADAWNEGFFTVGDAGYLDADGFLFLCDRKADMIIAGGVNIYPAEVEAQLVTHPAVLDAAVFGIPHPDFGEEVKAVVQPVPGARADDAFANELLAFLSERVAKYKLPRSIDFVSELPRDPNGKLYKRKLRDPYWQGRTTAI
ncbi:MAG TPA: acyl-CoA synthetase [Polyangiales bacterium]|nr:acyl-CoA synthetase [Polyangiales bacterium]